MTTRAKILTCVGAFLCVAAANVSLKPFILPEARVTIRMVNETGGPVAGADVEMFFNNEITHDPIRFHGETDGDGKVTAQGGLGASGVLGMKITKPGYYMGVAPVPHFREVVDNKWQPWDGMYEGVFRKIGSSIPMYSKKVVVDIPVTDQACGFDLMKGDWVAPYGKGLVSDLLVTYKRLRMVSRFDFDVSARISFPNLKDGIQETTLPPEFARSAFVWPRIAPELGYQPGLDVRYAWLPDDQGQKVIRTFDDKQAYFFRVRTSDRDGKIISALYGKIRGGIVIDPHDVKLGQLVFLYYLNPTPLDRNMEFDLDRNLLTDLSQPERPREP